MIKKNFFINLSFILLIFLLDRISKTYVIYLDNIFSGSEIFSSKFLNIYLIWNEGIAFGLFAFDDKFFYNLITGFIIFVVLTLLYFISKTKGIEKYSFLIKALESLNPCNLPLRKISIKKEIYYNLYFQYLNQQYLIY